MEAGITLRILVLAIAAVATVETAVILAVSSLGIPSLAGIGMARLTDIAVMAIILATTGSGFRAVGITPSALIRGLKRGCAWSALFVGLALMAGGLLMIVGADPLPWLGAPAFTLKSGLLPAFVVAVLLAPPAEELFFRGILFGYLRAWGFFTALGVSALAFAAAHSMTVGFPLVQLLGGIVLAFLYEREKNLMVPLVVHAVGNMMVMAIPLWFR